MKDKGKFLQALRQFLIDHRFYEIYPEWDRAEVEQFLESVLAESAFDSSSGGRKEQPEEAGTVRKRGEMQDIVLRVDGAARGNPGPAGIGIVIENPDGEAVETYKSAIGVATNNYAEYIALLEGLKRALKRKPETLKIFMDSQLVVEQIKGNYKVKHPTLRKLFREVKELLAQVPKWKIDFVPRNQNKLADQLANEALDEQQDLKKS